MPFRCWPRRSRFAARNSARITTTRCSPASRSGRCSRRWALRRGRAGTPRRVRAAPGGDRTRRSQHADGRGSLGGVYRRMNRLEDAERIWTDTLARQHACWATTIQRRCGTLNNIGVLYAVQGRARSCRGGVAELIERRRRILGPDHPEYLGSLGNLGTLLLDQGRFSDAEPSRISRGRSPPLRRFPLRHSDLDVDAHLAPAGIGRSGSGRGDRSRVPRGTHQDTRT